MATTFENRTKTITECNIANLHALDPMCDVAHDVLVNHKTRVTADDFKAAGVILTFDKVYEKAGIIYDKAELAERMRQANGLCGAHAADTDDLHPIAEVEGELRDALNAWFMYFGTREPRRAQAPAEQGKNRNQTPKYRPLYSVKSTDYYTIGKIAKQAQEMATSTTDKAVYDQFFINLLTVTARIIYGEPLTVIPDENIQAVMAKAEEKRKERADRANETRKANEQAKAEEARQKREEEKRVKAIEAENERLKADAINTAKVIALIQASHATRKEKDAIIEALCGKAEPQVTELVDDGMNHEPAKAETAAA